MSQLSVAAANQEVSAILDEIERIGIKAETEGRNLRKEEVARIAMLSKQFDACEKVLELHASE
jgi:hypothetical protein